MTQNRERVIVGLSGGVDSSVAAAILKKKGYDTVAVCMQNWPPRSQTDLQQDGQCTFEQDLIYAEMVAHRLKIPLHVVDLSELYYKHVAAYIFEEYAKGRTPNPDILCNRHIKFDAFIQATQHLDASYIATGHYARIISHFHPIQGHIQHLRQAYDNTKDQSYYLCQLNQKQLKNILFPIGDLSKSTVRRIASELHLPSAKRKDSYGICFVGEVSIDNLLSIRIPRAEGPIIEIPNNPDLHAWMQTNEWGLNPTPDLATAPGKTIGTHNRAHAFTVGQRKGLNIGGSPLPLYVLAISTTTNTLYVGQGQDHPLLYRRQLRIPDQDVHWIIPDKQLSINQEARYQVRIRYRQPLQPATLTHANDGYHYILFDQPQRGITPGQFAAWYHGPELIGSGPVDA